MVRPGMGCINLTPNHDSLMGCCEHGNKPVGPQRRDLFQMGCPSEVVQIRNGHSLKGGQSASADVAGRRLGSLLQLTYLPGF